MILLFVLGFGTKLGSVSLSQSFGHLSPWELDLECDTSVLKVLWFLYLIFFVFSNLQSCQEYVVGLVSWWYQKLL